jgi:hypothetical protein
MIKYNQVKFNSIDEEVRSVIGRNVKKTCIDTQSEVDSEDELGELPLHKASEGSPRDSDLTRKAGDFGLYIFYLESIGPLFALILMILAISFSILKKMPR